MLHRLSRLSAVVGSPTVQRPEPRGVTRPCLGNPWPFHVARGSDTTRFSPLLESLESRFDLAYGAAHALCLAALRHHGYRASKRYIVFQILPDTLGLVPEV